MSDFDNFPNCHNSYDFEDIGPGEYTYDFDYTYSFHYRPHTDMRSNDYEMLFTSHTDMRSNDYEMLFTSHTEYNNFIQAASRSPLETLEMFTKQKIQELATGIAEGAYENHGDNRPAYRSIPCLTFDSEGHKGPVYRSIPCLTFCTEHAYIADSSSCADGTESSCADGTESSCADGAESSCADGADSPYPASSARSSSRRYSSCSCSCSSSSSSDDPSTMNTNYMASIGTHMYDNPGTISSATKAYVSRERLAALEFLEKNISTIISEEVRKHYDGYTGSSNSEE